MVRLIYTRPAHDLFNMVRLSFIARRSQFTAKCYLWILCVWLSHQKLFSVEICDHQLRFSRFDLYGFRLTLYLKASQTSFVWYVILHLHIHCNIIGRFYLVLHSWIFLENFHMTTLVSSSQWLAIVWNSLCNWMFRFWLSHQKLILVEIYNQQLQFSQFDLCGNCCIEISRAQFWLIINFRLFIHFQFASWLHRPIQILQNCCAFIKVSINAFRDVPNAEFLENFLGKLSLYHNLCSHHSHWLLHEIHFDLSLRENIVSNRINKMPLNNVNKKFSFARFSTHLSPFALQRTRSFDFHFAGKISIKAHGNMLMQFF